MLLLPHGRLLCGRCCGGDARQGHVEGLSVCERAIVRVLGFVWGLRAAECSVLLPSMLQLPRFSPFVLVLYKQMRDKSMLKA